MSKRDIALSKKHGLTPAIPKCFYCGEDKNEIILAGRMKDDQEAPRGAVWDFEPCDKCRAWMEQGCIFISVRDGQSGNNPFRTGKWVVIRDEGVRRMIKAGPLQDQILKLRFSFIEDSTWAQLGLPDKEIRNEIP